MYNDIIKNLKIPYNRPQKLSDPNKDFEQQELEDIIHTKDCEMGFYELDCIFQGCLPAGSYEESAYFIPFALLEISKHDDGLLDDFLRWVSANKENIEKDDLLTPIMDYLVGIFQNYLSYYNIDEKSMYPDGGGYVTDFVSAVNEYFAFAADNIIEKYFETIHCYAQAAWFFYLLDHYCNYHLFFKSNVIDKLQFDNDKRRAAYDIICDKSMEDEKLLNYWDKFFSQCGMV